MSSSIVNFASRVLSVDQESTSFVPIVGLNKAPNMPILEAIMFAWLGCSTLRASMDEDDMEVLCHGLLSAFVTRVSDNRNWSAVAFHEPFRLRSVRLDRE
jgi:hypothetical protein